MSQHAHPHRHVPIDRLGVPRQAAVLELAAPLALGQRGLVVAPPRTGATTVLRWLAQALADEIGEAAVHVVLVDRDVEEQLEWREALPSARYSVTTSDAGDPQLHRPHAAVFAHARSIAEAGRDVAVVVDSFSALARAFAATSDPRDERVLDGGLPQLVLRELRSLLGQAFAVEGNEPGTLTILGTVLVDTAQELDEVVLHEFVGTGNVEWRLDADAMRAGLFPPVDVLGSGARRSELIIGEEAADQRARLRSEVDRHGTVAGLGMLELQLDEAGSLEALLRRLS